MSIGNFNIINRGGTVGFFATFYDENGVITQPDAAAISIVYPDQSGNPLKTQVPMTPPAAPAIQWTAEWDSRGAGPGTVYWSIHTGVNSPIPVAVKDGQFALTANPANLVTF